MGSFRCRQEGGIGSPAGSKRWWLTRAAGLVQPDPWLGLASEFPDIVAAQQEICRQFGVAPDLAADRLVQLYRRHCDEWTRFPAASLAETQRKAA